MMPAGWIKVKHAATGEDEVLVRISACGVCRTDLHIVDGDLPEPKLPIRTKIEEFALEDANLALEALRAGNLTGAAVLIP